MSWNWFRAKDGRLWVDGRPCYSLNGERIQRSKLVPTEGVDTMDKILKAAEALVAALKEHGGGTTAPARSGNRTTATINYRGGNAVQDLVDSCRRAVRVSRTGGILSKKERNIMRKVVKGAKAVPSYGIVNTNGVDVFSQHGA